jgi:2-dehydropantoate 2-reductase
MSKNILVLGTGAIGSCIAADLSRAEHHVTAVDQWPAHVEAMKKNGIRMITPNDDEPIPVRAFHLCEVCGLGQLFDIVLLTAKSYDTIWLVHFIKPYLKPDGILVSIQNSLNDEWIAPIIGLDRDIACVIELSAEIFTPGVVKRNTDRSRTWFALGELHGLITPRLHEMAHILSAAGKAETTGNIMGAKWSKLTVNCMTQAAIGILGIHEWEATNIPELFDLCIKLGRECVQVGSALGYTLEPIFGLNSEAFLGSSDEALKKILVTLISHIGKSARNSTLQDHLKGRKSEVELLNGLVAQKGKEAGVLTPLNEAMVSLTRRIEQGSLKPDRSNLMTLSRLTRS